MSDEAPKSAVELALERLGRQDADRGAEALTDDQKSAIAEIRRVHAARRAEAEIMHKAALATTWEPEARQKAEAEYRQDLDRMTRERDDKIAAVRGAGAS